MIITTISSRFIRDIALPDKISGQYWLPDPEEDYESRLAAVEGTDGSWKLLSNRQVSVIGKNGTAVKAAVLSPMTTVILEKRNGERLFVFAEPTTDDRQIYRKYLVREDTDLGIGRAENNDIVCRMPVISTSHALLSYRNGRWSIEDLNSRNGLFVNGKRMESGVLSIGDCIYMMGFRIVIGKNMIAMNNPDGSVSAGKKLIPFVRQEVLPLSEDEEEVTPLQQYFYRSPRFKREIETAKFKIDSPPQSPVGEEMPWVLVMGSSMAMGMMSLVTLSNAIIQHNIMSMAMGGSMLVGTLLLPTITKKYERNRRRKKEEIRQKKYREYLDLLQLRITDVIKLQERILRENIVETSECERRIEERSRNLWERSMGQNDFLKLRVGVGDGDLQAEFSYQEKKFSIDDDYLEEELYALTERPKLLKNVPVSVSLLDDPVSGVIGPREKVREFAKGLIIQLAALYSYDEVKLVFLYDPRESDCFDFVKWLPHCWSDDRSIRFIATDQNEGKEVSAYLMHVIENRKELQEQELPDEKPYYVIFSMSKSLADRTEVMKEILALKKNIHISLISVYEELKDLPRECSMVIDLSQAHGRLFDQNDISGKSTDFAPDIDPTKDPKLLSVRLANTSLDTLAANFSLPKTITFLEMLGVSRVEHLNASGRWKDNDPTKSLQVPVGVDTLGELFMLDLHEKYHGPHGLVAGMTGSGKSEFIITYILSLAVNYHPNEVAFILIDYKGGGMAKSFEKLPHTAGIITNLDGGAIKRSLVSIESELKRRQAIFAEAGRKVQVSNIDIYKYQRLYREGKVSEPLQHLFIISDEFAELKTQQPEFMAQLVSAARIGRSLGVHLILATQKPSGVVDDQIWSNSKFRVCLKVQERADSMDMLKRPDAAELRDTGRFYLQVGYNELFEMGQSAWAGAPYIPSDRVRKERDDSVAVVDRTGRPLREVRLEKKTGAGDGRKQLDVITEYLQKTAEEENIHIRPLWLPTIPAVILLSDLKKEFAVREARFHLNPLIGKYDDPARQRQDALTLPLSDEGNAVVYGAAGAGKTSFLNAMLVSLITEHTPEEVNIYVLDFASETLGAFRDAPQVGDVLFSYEAEKLGNLFKMLRQETEKRKKLFSDYGGDYVSYIRSSGSTLPSIVVAVNNFAALTETYPELEEAVLWLSREGTKYGVYFVLTSLGTGGVRFRLLQNFRQQFVLQLNDETDYATVVGRTEGLFPAKYKGRGLVRKDDLYEFQTASVTEDPVPFESIRTLCRNLRESWTGETAKRIPILPELVDLDFIRPYIRQDQPLKVPVGVERNSLAVHYLPLDRHYISLIVSSGDEYLEFCRKLVSVMMLIPGFTVQVLDSANRLELREELPDNWRLSKRASDCEAAVNELFETVLYRNNTWKDALEKGESCEPFNECLVMIPSISALRDSLSEQGQEKLSLILEKGRVEYAVHIILGDQQKLIGTMAYESWFKANISPSDGLFVGSGITEQYLLKTQRTTPEMRQELPHGFGWSVQKGKAVLVKLLADPESGEDDES